MSFYRLHACPCSAYTVPSYLLGCGQQDVGLQGNDSLVCINNVSLLKAKLYFGIMAIMYSNCSVLIISRELCKNYVSITGHTFCIIILKRMM